MRPTFRKVSSGKRDQQIFVATVSTVIVVLAFGVDWLIPNQLGSIGMLAVGPILAVFFICPARVAGLILVLAVLGQIIDLKDGHIRLLTGLVQIAGLALAAFTGWQVRGLVRNLQLQQDRRAERARLAFLSNAAHQLRTPLGIFRSFFSNYSIGAIGREELLEAVPVIQAKAEEMSRVVEDMLAAGLPEDELTDRIIGKEES